MFRFLVGLGIGLFAGVLFAPASGEETRLELRRRARELKGEAIEKGREQAGKVGQEVGQRLYDRAVGEEGRVKA